MDLEACAERAADDPRTVKRRSKPWGTYDSLKSNMCGGAVNEPFVYYPLV
jgi:hypothetical protein